MRLITYLICDMMSINKGAADKRSAPYELVKKIDRHSSQLGRSIFYGQNQ
jgi:hypothetical protein